MKVIPSKLVPPGRQPMGIKNMSEVETEIVKLLPTHANATQEYAPGGVNRIQFRIPAFTNSWLDNSRSFLSYKIQTIVANSDALNDLKLGDTPGCWVSRLVVKSSSGLVLEDINNYNVLKKILTSMETEESAKADEGNYAALTAYEDLKVVCTRQKREANTYILKFNTGILSQHLNAYLPLHIMDKGSFAFDVELYLANSRDCMEYVTDEPDATLAGGLDGRYIITNPTFNLFLVKVDESICKKYNQISCDETERVVIPYSTFHNHQSSVSSQTQTVFISDNCTDLKRVYSVFHNTQNDPDKVAGANLRPWDFKGSVAYSGGERLISYNYKLGNKRIYNEDVQETDNNNESLNHFLNAHYKGAKPCCPSMHIAKMNFGDASAEFQPNYETNGDFVLCPNFTYSEESSKGVIQGVSAGGLPITATFKFAGTPNLTNNNFVECGYDLVIQNGQLSYVEHRLDGEYSY